MKQETTVLWLKAGSALTVFFGVLIALASIPAANAPVEILADLIFFPVDGAQNVGAPETRLMNAIGGGVMTGWGIMIWMLATRLYPREPALAKQLIVTSVVAWFVVDSAGSLMSGAPLNALFNVSFLLIFCVPLWLAGRQQEAVAG
ncbi:MAG: hypothetical protein QNI99_02780 [Woeseiaceae bacterium]|nr:hypothetical protein [Woeseiaceae bacterium]